MNIFVIFNQNIKKTDMKKIDLTKENIEDMINDVTFKKNLLILEGKKEELEICESILIKLQNAIYEQR